MTTVVVVLTVLAVLLALTWLQNRASRRSASGRFPSLFAPAPARSGAPAQSVPSFFAIDFANAMRLTRLRSRLVGRARSSSAGRKAVSSLLSLPPILWLVASLHVGVRRMIGPRVVVTSLLIGTYALAMAAELCQRGAAAASGRLARRDPARRSMAPSSSAAPSPRLSLPHLHLGLADGAGGPVNPIVIFEALIVAVALAFLLVSAAKEQLETHHREASLIDPLTGISNRRGFDMAVGRNARARPSRRLVDRALLLDLDHFKVVNDTWGHQLGDAVLQGRRATRWSRSCGAAM